MKTNPTMALALLLTVFATHLAAEVSHTTVHHFGDPAVRASWPEPLAAAADGTFYGVTAFGGANNGGLLYRLSSDGARYTVIREFGVNAALGSQPRGAVLVGPDGFLYGGTQSGGTNDTGVIYRVATSGASYSVVHNITGGVFSFAVHALINGSDGRIYGAIGDEGVVGFDAGGGNYSVLHADSFFQGGSLFEIAADPRLYVIEPVDDSADGDGAFYRLNKNGTGYTTLRSRIPFGGAAPAPTYSVQPFAAFQADDGSIMGIESYFNFVLPNADGTFVFRASPNGVVWDEAGLSGGSSGGLGAVPTSFLQGADGAFYGSISKGTGATLHGYLFRFQPYADPLASWQNLFDWPSAYTGPGGLSIKAIMEGSDQRIYGASVVGGRLSGGALFRINRSGTGFTQLLNFAVAGDGTNAAPPVIFAADGRLYGTTQGGGSGGRGTIYRADPNQNDYRVLGQFTSDAEGIDPRGGVIDGGDGFLYGATRAGGSQGFGTLYKVRPDGTDFSVQFNFRNDRPGAVNPVDPANSVAALLDGGDGFLYGVGFNGGSAANRGGVFKAAKDGTTFTNIHGFAANEGRGPSSPLTLGSDGRLYGTAETGGVNDLGTVFSLNRDGSGFQLLHSFTGGANGGLPTGALVRDATGSIYGVTLNGGANLLGTLYRLQPGGSGYAVIHSFGAGTDGRRPSGGVIEAADGSLIGSTRFGGSGAAGQQFGTIFKVNKDGTGYEVLRSFTSAGSDGESPFAALASGTGDTFFGTTSLGGTFDQGTFFKMVVGNPSVALSLAPSVVTLRSGQSRVFTPGGGTPPYTFSFAQNLSGGTVDPATGLYLAGPVDTVLDKVRVTDSLGATATATIAVVPLNLVITAATPQEFLDLITHIDGNIILDNVDTRPNLLLPNLISVGGDIIIQDNDQLTTTDVSALQLVGGTINVGGNSSLDMVDISSLTSVGGTINVGGNSSLDMVDISSLTSVGGTINVGGNSSLDMVDISSLTSVGGTITVDGNSSLDTVDISSLTSVGGSVDISGNGTAGGMAGARKVRGNDPAVTIDLHSLGSVGSDVTIIDNDGATVIDLSSLATVGESIEVSANDSATVINLASLDTVGSDVTIIDNDGATVVDLASLATVGGSIEVSGNAAANPIDLSSLGSVGSDVTIIDNDGATVIDLSQLDSIDGSLDISGNGTAGGMAGARGVRGGDPAGTGIELGALTTVGGSVDITGNTSSTGIDLGSLTSVGGSVDISDNSAATGIDVGSLASVGGSIDVSGNTSVTGIGLGLLMTVGGSVDVTHNTAATGVNLSSLASVGGSVDVSGNTSATGIDLRALTTVGGSVDVTGNTSVTGVDLRSLTSVGGATGGNVTIASNAANGTTNLSGLQSIGNGTNPATMTLEQGTFLFSNGFTNPAHVTLTGSGTLAGNITNNGTLAPGASPGRFDITGNLVLTATSVLRLEISSYPGGLSDFLNVSGSLTLGGMLVVSMASGSYPQPIDGAGFTLFTAGGPVTGAFANAASGAILTTADGYARFTLVYAGQNSLQVMNLEVLDADRDGAPDAAEAADGTNPNNSASLFRILAVSREQGGVRITWSTVAGKRYAVQVSESSGTRGPFDSFVDASPPIDATGAGESTANALVADPPQAALSRRYFRIRRVP